MSPKTTGSPREGALSSGPGSGAEPPRRLTAREPRGQFGTTSREHREPVHQVSAPQIVATTAITRTSSSRCEIMPSDRGSSSVSKCSKKAQALSVVVGVGILPCHPELRDLQAKLVICPWLDPRRKAFASPCGIARRLRREPPRDLRVLAPRSSGRSRSLPRAASVQALRPQAMGGQRPTRWVRSNGRRWPGDVRQLARRDTPSIETRPSGRSCRRSPSPGVRPRRSPTLAG